MGRESVYRPPGLRIVQENEAILVGGDELSGGCGDCNAIHLVRGLDTAPEQLYGDIGLLHVPEGESVVRVADDHLPRCRLLQTDRRSWGGIST